MSVTPIAPASRSALLAGSLSATATRSVALVNVVNGVKKSSLVQKVAAMAAGATAPRLLAGGAQALPGSAANPLTLDLGFVGYNQSGSTAVADINPDKLDMPTVTVKVTLRKGFKYSVGSDFRYELQTNKTATASLSVMAPSATKAQALSLQGGTFTAKESGDYSFTWALSNGARFVGGFSASIAGQAPALPKTTGDTRIDAVLQRQDAWWHEQGTAPAKSATLVMPKVYALTPESSRQQLSYSFISDSTVPTDVLTNDFPSAGQSKQFAQMDDNQKAATRAALAYISSVTHLSFTEAVDGSGNIQLGDYNMDPQAGGKAGLDGIASLPGSYPLADKSYVFINAYTNSDLGGSTPGTPGWTDVWHEIGHALGLKHPGNYDAAGGGGTRPFLPAATDNRQYSIMSYKPAAAGASNLSYMLYDVAALQFLYGVNASGSTASGDVAGAGGQFSFSSSAPALSTIYSATGKDTIDLSGLVDASTINLNAGSYSRIGYTGAAASSQNMAIAWGSRINKVKLGDNNVSDTVVLNTAFKQGAYNEITQLQANDRIALSKSIFGKLSTRNIEIGSSGAASSKTSRIVVNQSTGEIFYDADGNGSRSAAVKIATYQAVQGVSLTTNSFAFLA